MKPEFAEEAQHLPRNGLDIVLSADLGMVRQWQQLFFDRRYSQTPLELPIDFVKLAEAYGATGLRATSPQEVAAVIKQGFATPGPVIMEFKVAREENVLPMVPAGRSIHEMVLAS
jgi:acetolactate synthase-1/2/3 large subunit